MSGPGTASTTAPVDAGGVDPALLRIVGSGAAAPGAAPWEVPLADFRAHKEAGMLEVASDPDRMPEELALETDRGTQVTLYRPDPGREPVGGLVFIHGGGWVIGTRASYAKFCRRLAVASGLAVASVEYRLAPEHPFPASVDDAAAATAWIQRNAAALGLDPARIGVGGDSAGGNLAAVSARRARDEGHPVAFLLLLYPALSNAVGSASYAAFAGGPVLAAAEYDWFWSQYVGPGGNESADASPLDTPDLRGMPPTVILSAGNDLVRDGAEVFGERLAAAGIPTVRLRALAMPHAFLNFTAEFAPARHIIAALGGLIASLAG